MRSSAPLWARVLVLIGAVISSPAHGDVDIDLTGTWTCKTKEGFVYRETYRRISEDTYSTVVSSERGSEDNGTVKVLTFDGKTLVYEWERKYGSVRVDGTHTYTFDGPNRYRICFGGCDECER